MDYLIIKHPLHFLKLYLDHHKIYIIAVNNV